MTTAPRTPRTGQRPGVAGRAVAVAGLATLAVGAVLAGAGALTEGTPAAAGAAVGLVMVLAFFGLGAVVLDVVAGVAPALSLLVALLTYTLQVVLVGLVFVGLSRSGLLGSQLDADWVGGTVIAGTLTWLAAQVVTTVRTRRPVYDLPSPGTPSDASEAASEEPRLDGSGGLSGRKEATAR
jgi:ATP synthase protein I